MSFEKHIFISYAHDDNKPLSGQETGWITRFHEDLRDRLKMYLRNVEIWRDDRLRGNSVFSDEIHAQFPKTALLVSVLSQSYIQSEWCRRELQAFCEAASQSGGLRRDNLTRLIKIVKWPVDRGEMPPVLDEALGYEFFVRRGSKAPLELDPVYGKDYSEKFHTQMADLAYELAETLKKLSQPAAPVSNGGAKKPVVYLAECGYDCGEMRQKLRSELRLHGYEILPDKQMPATEEEYVKLAAEMLGQSQLAIHVVGSDYGMVPYGPSGKSVPVLQNELAIARAKRGGLERIIWLPDGTEAKKAEQAEFINALKTDAEAQFGADLITSDIETVKSAIHEVLEKLQKPKPKPVEAKPEAAESVEKMAYIVADASDKEAILPLRRYLKNKGYIVRVSPTSGDPAEVRQVHAAALKIADLVLLYFGAGSESWWMASETEVVRVMKTERGPVGPAKVIRVLGAPDNDEKDFLSEEKGVVDARGEFPAAGLDEAIGK